MDAGIGEVESIDTEVRNLLRELEEDVNQLESGHLTDHDVPRIKGQIEQVDRRIKTMEIELRSVNNRDTARKFKPVIKEHQKKLKEISQTLEWREAGRSTASPQDKVAGKYGDISKDKNAAIQYGKDLQDKTHGAADRALQDLAITNEIAADTAVKVYDQTKQIENISKEIKWVDEELDRAGAVLKRMRRRVMTDNYIKCLILLIFIAIVAIIALAIYNGTIDTSSVSPDI